MSKNEKNPIVFQNERVTVFKNGTWACETCRRKARSRGIRQPDVIPRGKRCKSTDEYGSICNKYYYLDDPDLAERNNTARGRKTRGRKTRGRKTRGRKTRQRKRKNTKNTRYQKRAR
jgi:hypothetical protein